MSVYSPFQGLPEVLSVKDLTSQLQISRSFALKLIHEKRIPAHKIARQWKILKPDVIDYVLHTRTTDTIKYKKKTLRVYN